jgi:hypothetical protein
MYRLIWTAVANKQPISAMYKELPRLFCPDRLGRNRLGQPRVLCYQYGGESETGLGHSENWRQLQPDTTETRLLHFLVEQRRQTVDQKTREGNRLTGCLKLYFPEVLGWFDDVSSPLVGELLERWPSLEQLQRAGSGGSAGGAAP